jgi:amino acid adenylation domain-containing protein
MTTSGKSLDELRRAAALRLLQARQAPQAAARPADRIPPADRTRPVPLSWSQQRLWFLDRLDPAAGAAYHMPAGLRLLGRLDADALRAALARVVERHEILRTRFVEIDGDPAQVVEPGAGLALAVHDLSGLHGNEQRAAVDRLAFDNAMSPFDLARDPLLRAALLRLADEEHVLLLTQHHIVSDGWSIGVLVREFCALYAAFATRRPDPLPPLAIQYADYAAWQRAWLADGRAASQRDFWVAHLQGAPALLELPTDHPRPPRQSYRGASLGFAVPPALAAGLRALSQRHGMTLFMTLLAGWSLLLSRLSGQADVVVGTAIANRPRTELEPLLGFFVNTLALRLRFDGEPTLAETLARTRQVLLQAYAHQDLPFEQVVEALQPPRSMAHSPVFQAMFALDNTPASALSLPGLSLEPLASAHQTTHFDVLLSMNESGDALSGRIEYASDLFEPATIERMSRRLLALLQAMVDDEAQPAGRAPLMSVAERTQVLQGFNATRRDFPADQLLHERFAEQVRLRPDAVALQHGEASLSYAALDARANRIAHRLLALGARPDDRVALCATRSFALVAGMLGILKAGAAYLPLDPDHPTERVADMLADAAPVALLAEDGLLDEALRPAMPVLPLGTLYDDDAGDDTDPQAPQSGSRQLAYVMYTSGSTGRPKGVMVEHRNVMRLAVNGGFADIGPGDRVAHAANPAFDASTWEIWAPLLNGATCVIVSQEVMLEPRRLEEELRAQRVSAMWMTVGLFNRYVSLLSGAFGGLEHLLIGGDALDPASVSRLLAGGAAPRRLVNGYGPTETTTFATTFPIAPDDAARAIPIGRPIGNTQVYVLDAHRDPVPVGVAGELWIGGDGVARGYLNRPDLTEERFVADPFSSVPGARLYRTGDLGRWRADGTLEYLGRNDFQVKLRGFRVELGEIESRLLACDGVRDTVVLVREDAPGDKRLVAYVLTHPGCVFDPAALRAELATQLADYMVPSAFVRLDAFPLTGNGKLDRAALPAPAAEAHVTRAYEAPLGPVEEAIARIWRELLGLERIGRQDHFFELGGHSLMAIQLCARLREALQVELPLREVFTQPTLAALAAAVAKARGEAPAPLAPIERADRSGPLPLSWPQQRLWFLAQLDAAAGAAYHLPAALRLAGRLDVDALRATLARVVERHEALRTRFEDDGGQPVARIADAAGAALAWHDLSALAAAAREAEVTHLAHENATAPFDLARGPLLRAALLRLGAEEHVLLLTQHHIVSDGWSMGVLVREVCALYAAFATGRPDPLPPLALQYADYAAWQRQWLKGEPLQAQVDWWRGHLAGAPALLELPCDRPRPTRQSHRGASHAFALPPALVAQLRALSQRHGTTLFMTLLAGWSLLLARLAGQEAVVVGTPVANRPRAELEPLIGFFVNTLALHVRIGADDSVADLLARVQQVTLEAYAHQDLPFEQVVEAVRPVRTLAHSPVFQAMFTLDNTPSGTLALPDLQATPLAGAHKTTQFDLSLSMVEADGGLAASIEYATELFDAATIARWAGHLRVLLEGMAAEDTRLARRVPLLAATERAALVDGFNAARVQPAAEAGLVPAFERQVRAQPHAVAVEAGDRALSYAALDAAANRIAHRLASRGVRPGDRVAICAGRDLALVAGLLGILKAGAAYVPLDPGYPAERLAFMRDDAAPAALLAAPGLVDAGGVPVVPLLDPLDDDGTGVPAHAPVFPRSAEDIAYVIYTSGSTGRPKGVEVPHRGALNLWRALDATALHDLAPRSRVALNAAVSFDASVQGLLQLLSGHTLVLVPAATRTDPDAMLDFLRARDIDVLDGTPAQLEGLLAAGRPLRPSRILVGGEAISDALWRAMAARTSTRFFNVYGPTECSVDTTCAEIAADRAPHLGRPLPNTRVYVLDAAGEPVPAGVTGELFIGGAGVARGYLHRPELTAARFLPDPFDRTPGARMYRSGDLGRWRADGTLDYLGRNDFQVKLRGFRIELGEIEAALREAPGVREAAVLVREDVPGDKRLVGYVTLQPGAEFDAGALRLHLARGLADYMVPAAFVTMDAFPLTPSAKLDRAALPAPEAGRREAPAGEAPAGAHETAIAAIWREALGVAQVGRDESFFDLGGHSLLAIRVMHRVNEGFGTSLPIAALFAAPTVRALGMRVEAAGAAAVASSTAAESSANAATLSAAAADGLLVPLRPASPGAPALFCVHPIGGEVAPYAALAERLEGFAVWGLQAPELAGEAAPRSLADLAARHAAAIRTAGPGPYRLLGWSSGGRFAIAVAEALQRAGAEVANLFLLDVDRRRVRPLDASRRGLDALLNLVASVRGSAPSDAEVRAMVEEAAAHGWTVRRLLADDRGGEPPRALVDWLARWTHRPAHASLVQFVRSRARLAAAQLALLEAAGDLPPALAGRTACAWARESGLRERQPTPGEGDLVVDASHHALLQPPHVAQLAPFIVRASAVAPGPDSSASRSHPCQEIPG